MLLSITMLFLGLLLGFIGAGGSGFIIAILVTVFHIPIHEALGTAVPVMFINVITGSMSHFREGNIYVKQGLLVGLFGGIGAYFGMRLTTLINPNVLMLFTVFALASSGVLIWLKTRMKLQKEEVKKEPVFLSYVGIGLGNGLISGTFGIGAAPFIQLSLLKWLHFPMRIAAGTTMLVLLPVAFFASIGSIQNGYFDLMLFFQVAISTMFGTYVGAKLTSKLPQVFLRYGIVVTPIVSATLLLMNFL
ncbi:sulfite exporter TauE/SafE family protein [Bacillus sp. 1NLA3E]|uniref:sulfite exporter TauE/SafE family protein n=1 Tax=Bacillus sp. 1NLA3E TaxID=666686 RepID=UPI000247ED91|nr:sulfite exporter TauE/SafE family protein [Bacillus sp. 1NLA3E]AGK53540.1 permease [Bacillus sp. 1NLA3E]